MPYFLAEHTLGLIDNFAASDKPFFIWHSFWGPHLPYYIPEEVYDLYRNVEIPEWPNYRWPAREKNGPFQVKIHPLAEQLEWEDWAEAIRHYYAFATLIDQQIGRIVDHLDQAGLRDNTVVILSADHGETLGAHGGLIDKGWHHFEDIQRIPLIMWLPEQYQRSRERGSVLKEWASLLDIYPTILDLAGATYPADSIHGRSLLPVLQGEVAGWRDSLFVEFYGVDNLITTMITARVGNLKYGWNCSNRDELYDLVNDPYEMNNLIDDLSYHDQVIEMRERLEAWMVETGHGAIQTYRTSRLGKYRFWED